MPIGDRMRRRRRKIRDGDSYTIDDENEDRIELEIPERINEPPVDIQGEVFGWTKEGHKPIGYRKDNDYGPTYRDRNDPGPNDGEWDPE